jgi:uncharacterized protein YbjQ (UPF0145 family)
MKKNTLILACIIITGCSTSPTRTSVQVIEYKTIENMNGHAECTAIDSAHDQYSVFMHSPWGRKRAAHIRLKDAAFAKGANAVIMISNNYGVITDQVQGVAYKCTYGQK